MITLMSKADAGSVYDIGFIIYIYIYGSYRFYAASKLIPYSHVHSTFPVKQVST